ncbi:uncharacterized protein PHALS_02599 [Plasmopara halstedii]|uniref:Uncharacterized protein n=1 Tax=Plasmopara halstedii TaxID=4781 RepID=A0A0P1AUY1_PLAHL|nr:uncharacterized protein PHALS_02599 [Plasmopara halstedii]CEG46184.1 hypothetical protein PHALS_02599 [Plasmopara halstedii]|eukprot:XP_024582553.1 hypothetical protein PHALS_02599 [Plasmopara halstedii]
MLNATSSSARTTFGESGKLVITGELGPTSESLRLRHAGIPTSTQNLKWKAGYRCGFPVGLLQHLSP